MSTGGDGVMRLIDMIKGARLSEKYTSRSGATFCLVEMQAVPDLILGISKAKLEESLHLKIEITRSCVATDVKDRAKITALFDRFVRFYKAHWVEVAE